jgi:predicted RNA methylase
MKAILNHTVDRWHFRMLNDERRNHAYRGAIQRAAFHAENSIFRLK